MSDTGKTKTVIFTDLDGSLLHPKTYSFREAMPALELIRRKGIPLVLSSSKSREELELYRRRLSNDDPFIAENGGAVVVPVGYFPSFPGQALRDKYLIHVFGTPYQEVRRVFVELRHELKTQVRGFGDMSVAEIAALTGLPRKEAAIAREREFSEPFIFERGPDDQFLKAIKERGLRWTRGRLYCIMGDHDKGTPVQLLKKWFTGGHGTPITIGIGDGINDIPLLEETDYPVLVQKEDGGYDPGVDVPHLIRAEGVGPEGWNRAVLALLGKPVL